MRPMFLGAGAALLSVALLLPGPARAQDGFIQILPPPRTAMVLLTPHAVRADATLRDQMARVVVEQDYVNPTSRPLEGMVCFPLARDASISDFSMYVDGKRLEGILLDAEQARRTYEEIVRQRRDPALLELVGRGMLRARLFPIPPGGSRTLRIEYGQVLRATGSRTEFALPFAAGEGGRPVPFTATVTVHTRGRLGPVYSPTHALDFEKRDAHVAVVTAHGEAAPGRDLTLLVAEDRRDLGTQVLTARRGEGAGYFLVFAMPWQEREKRTPTDIVFALDVSGSMSGPKIEQARRALRYCLDRLGPEDRFALLAFSTQVTALSRRLTPATGRELDEARAFVDGLSAAGGTNIADALSEALALARDGRNPMVVFLTDGLPTVGVTSISEIESRARDRRPEGAHLFTFGVGYDVNAPFLDRLAADGRGASDYVKPEEDIEEKVSALFDKVSAPALRDVTVSVSGARAFDVYPKQVPDLFHGEQLAVLGRFEGSGGTATVTVRGFTPDGRAVSVRAAMPLRPRPGRNAYVPTLWASRKIAYLTDQARLEGETPELRETIVGLSRDYGILTQYTSYYVGEEQERPQLARKGGGRGDAPSPLESLLGGLRPSAPMAAAPPTGRGAVTRSLELNRQKAAVSLDEADRAEAKAEGASGIASRSGRLFENRSGVWTDTRHDSSNRVIRLLPFGAAYMELLRRHPELAAAAGLGDHMILAGRGLSIEIVKGGADRLSDAQWNAVEQAFR
jgi:Ca-activated chloride channel family protein